MKLFTAIVVLLSAACAHAGNATLYPTEPNLPGTYHMISFVDGQGGAYAGAITARDLYRDGSWLELESNAFWRIQVQPFHVEFFLDARYIPARLFLAPDEIDADEVLITPGAIAGEQRSFSLKSIVGGQQTSDREVAADWPVPEPATAALLLPLVLGVLRRRAAHKKSAAVPKRKWR